MDGTTNPTTSVKPPVINLLCPGCGAGIRITAVGLTLTFSCQSCGALIDVQNHSSLKLLKEGYELTGAQMLIPLEARGVLFGRQWQVVGFMVRTDGPGEFEWREYLLFNPAHGFRWLVESDGHWSFVERVRDNPQSHGQGRNRTLTHRGIFYRRFLEGKGRVLHVVGEFYWRVARGEEVDTADFVGGIGQGLSIEATPAEVVISLATYVEPGIVSKAFGLPPGVLPSPLGISPLQPNPHPRGQSVLIAALIFCLIILGVRMGASESSNSPELVNIQGDVLVGSPGEFRVSEPFHISRPTALEVRFAERDLSNAYMELDGKLFNESTGESWDIDAVLSYYEGTDGDGYWSEGNSETTQVLSGMAPGDYRFAVSAKAKQDGVVYADRGLGEHRIKFNAVVGDNSGEFGMTLLALFLIGVPAWRVRRRHAVFEMRRWQNSDEES